MIYSRFLNEYLLPKQIPAKSYRFGAPFIEEATELMLMMDPPSGIFATRAFTIQNMLLTLMSMLLCKIEDLRLLNIDKIVIYLHSCFEITNWTSQRYLKCFITALEDAALVNVTKAELLII